MEVLFSVITLYYRGDRFLASLKATLEAQVGDQKFEWIIVDDFSNDLVSHKAISKIAVEANFPVKFIFLEQNFIGAQSVRRALKIAEGQFVIILDQDDWLPVNALAIFADALERNRGVDGLAGVCGRCIDQNGNLIGPSFPWKEKFMKEPELRHTYRFKGELFQCTNIERVREHIDGFDPGFTNGWLWNRIARTHGYIYSNSVVRVYNRDNPDALSRSRQVRFPCAQFRQLLEYLVDNASYLDHDTIGSAKILVQWMRVGLHIGHGYSTMRGLLPSELRPWSVVAFLLACGKFARDQFKV